MKTSLKLLFYISLMMSTIPFSIAQTFPEDWLGTWEGDFVGYNQMNKAYELTMRMEITETENPNRWHWKTIYPATEQTEEIVKDYYLEAIDLEKGYFVTDEDNSILLDTYLVENTFYSRFLVQENLILSMYRWENGKINFEIVFGNDEPNQTTGGEEDIPEVQSYAIPIIQKATLEKID